MNQLKSLITALTLVQRLSIGAAALIAGGAIAALVHYHNEGDFRPLYTAMAPEDAAPVVQKLKESGVEYRLADSGGSVLVPSGRLAESRLTLAAAGLPKSGRIGFELFDKTNFGATELVEHVNYQRALEGELERSVMSMAEVTQARVHLTMPRESVFLDQQQPSKASVLIRLRPGARISAQNVLAVSNLVASAVEGLNPDAVAVLDMDGNLLSRPRKIATGENQITTESLEVRQQMEHDLVAKINSTLEPLLGAEQFRAGASVDCDLTSGEQQEETYNPDQSVMVTSQKSEDVNERASAGGVPGTAANLPHPPTTSGSGGGTSHRTENVTYQSSRIVRHTRIPQGVVRRMSLSVLLGQPAHWEGTGKNRHRVLVPPSAETMKTIRELVAGATGFNAERGDQLIVETLPFESAMDLDSDPLGSGQPKSENQPPWMQMILKYRFIGGMVVGGLLLLGIVFKVLRGMMSRRGAPAEARTADQLEAAAALRRLSAQQQAGGQEQAPAIADSLRLLAEAHAETADRIRQFAQRDTAAATNVVRMWLQEKKA